MCWTAENPPRSSKRFSCRKWIKDHKHLSLVELTFSFRQWNWRATFHSSKRPESYGCNDIESLQKDFDQSHPTFRASWDWVINGNIQNLLAQMCLDLQLLLLPHNLSIRNQSQHRVLMHFWKKIEILHLQEIGFNFGFLHRLMLERSISSHQSLRSSL